LRWLKTEWDKRQTSEILTPAFWMSGMQGDSLVLTGVKSGKNEKIQIFLSAHLVSPECPVPGAVSLLLSRELARHNNRTRRQARRARPARPPPACPHAGCWEPNRACRGLAGKSRTECFLVLLAQSPAYPPASCTGLGPPLISELHSCSPAAPPDWGAA
jgi:hypothetical protein